VNKCGKKYSFLQYLIWSPCKKPIFFLRWWFDAASQRELEETETEAVLKGPTMWGSKLEARAAGLIVANNGNSP